MWLFIYLSEQTLHAVLSSEHSPLTALIGDVFKPQHTCISGIKGLWRVVCDFWMLLSSEVRLQDNSVCVVHKLYLPNVLQPAVFVSTCSTKQTTPGTEAFLSISSAC